MTAELLIERGNGTPPPGRSRLDSLAREFMERYEDDVDQAAPEMAACVCGTYDPPPLVGEAVEVACRYLCRRVRSLARAEATAETALPPTGYDSGRVLVDSLKDPFDWPVPYINKRLGDCTPEELREAAEQCYTMAHQMRQRGDVLMRFVAQCEAGKPLRESLTAERAQEILEG